MKKDQHKILVPIFTSEIIDSPDPLFQNITYGQIASSITRRIATYNASKEKRSSKIYSTLKERVIEKIEVTEHKLGEHPILLLRITAYETNLKDVFVETLERIHLESRNKVGSENNIVLLYPEILGMDPANFSYRWIAFVYEEPSKDRGEVISVCKLVLQKILGIAMRNFKLPSVMDELKKAGTIDELSIKFYTVESDLNEVDLRYKTYVSRFQTRKQKDTTYSHIPFDEASELLRESDEPEYKVKEVKISLGKRELKYKENQKQEMQTETELFAEELFNESVPLNLNEIERIYDVDFVLEKLKPVVQKFVSDHAR